LTLAGSAQTLVPVNNRKINVFTPATDAIIIDRISKYAGPTPPSPQQHCDPIQFQRMLQQISSESLRISPVDPRHPAVISQVSVACRAQGDSRC
jgi:hypothetical protein